MQHRITGAARAISVNSGRQKEYSAPNSAILGGKTPTVGVDELKSALRDRFDRARGRAVAHPTMSTVCRVDNVMGLVVDVGAGRLWVTEGPGGASPDPAWVAFHLPSLLATPDAAATPGAQYPVMALHVVRIVDAPLAGGRPAGAYRPTPAGPHPAHVLGVIRCCRSPSCPCRRCPRARRR